MSALIGMNGPGFVALFLTAGLWLLLLLRLGFGLVCWVFPGWRRFWNGD